MSKKTKYFLWGILLLSTLLHLWRISLPHQAVFDEVHYATYAAEYVNQTPFFDVHPPLGKFLYSLPLHFVSKKNLSDAPFVILTRDTAVKYTEVNRNYTTFPFIALRVLSAISGVLLVLAIFLFMREFTKKDSMALLAALFVALENSLLLETRLILLDGFFLSLSFFALWQFLKQSDAGVKSGILWGCALATKLVGIIFLPFILIQKSGFWKNYKFITAGFLTLGILWVGIQWCSFKANTWFYFMKSVNTNISEEVQQIPNHLSFIQSSALKAYLLFHEVSWSAQGYSTIQAAHPAQSYWYQWPLMIGSFCYEGNEFPLCMIGNPALWGMAFMTLIGTILYIAIQLLKKQKINRTIKTLVFGYIFALAPFAIIPRYMFIYHYFPALIFSLCITAYWAISLIERIKEKKYQIISYLALIGIVCIGFFAISPVTFGLR